MPPMPRSAAFRSTSAGKWCARSHSTAWGVMVSAVNSETMATRSRWSSLMVNKVNVLWCSGRASGRASAAGCELDVDLLDAGEGLEHPLEGELPADAAGLQSAVG